MGDALRPPRASCSDNRKGREPGDDEIVADQPLAVAEPNREDFEGYAGNAGMTLERWYHRAAVVIWPRVKHFHVLCGAGPNAAVGGLEAMVRRLKRATKKQREVQLPQCLAFAAAILDSWQQDRYGRRWQEPEVERNAFSALLCELNDPDLVRRFLAEVMPVDDSVQLDTSFGKFARQHGWAGFEAQLATIFAMEKHLARPTGSCPPIAKWLSSCRSELERRTVEPPRKPADFRRESKLSCNCGDCRALARFLGDPNERQARFPLAKHRRQHLHQIIEGNRCDCTRVTERRGSPYTLVCTKTTASYEAACGIYLRDVNNLRRVAALEEKLS